MSLFPQSDIPAGAAPPAYRVLARKYRPSGFDTLIGQDAMVTTLGNAIAANRLAQAWLLTGVRGVGKTSTARIIAKALNCIGADGQGGPTMQPCGVCANCTAITAGQHIDVTEMDAASNTGVDDAREIIEAARYAAVSARYKIYIIDEVHMLSKHAWNALLKTLEEPPPHVKFIFATTEVEKIPATILSRCQRFDLKRVPADMLKAHFGRILESEGATGEEEALTLVARAAQGSVRDGLSILDQAIAMGDGHVTAGAVRAMLGLADRGRTAGLLGHILAGDAAAALAALQAANSGGVEAHSLFVGLMEMVHAITRARLSGQDDATLSAEDQAAVRGWAAQLDFPRLHRLWQLLLKGLADIGAAPDPAQAADMAVLRIIHAAALPDPDLLARLLAGDAPAASAAPRAGPAAALPGPVDFAAILALAEQHREALLFKQLHDDVACISITPGCIDLAPTGPLPSDFSQTLARNLSQWLGSPWQVRITAPAPHHQSLHQQSEETAGLVRLSALQAPIVAALLSAFEGAQLTYPQEPNANRIRTAS